MALVGLDGRFRAVNRAFCDLLGYPESELLGRHPAEVTHPDDQERSFAVVGRLLGGETRTDQIQKRYVRRDGSVVEVVRTTTALRDADGRAVGLFTQMLDVTAHTRMQEALVRSDSRFKALVAHSSDLTVLVDAAGRIFYASPASRPILGCPPEEMEGLTPFEFIHPDEIDRAHQAFAGHLSADHRSDPAHYRVVRRNGSRRDVEVVTTNLIDDPAVGALVVNIKDVTEARRNLTRLEAAERRFRTLVGNSWDIISLHDADGRYLYCSPAVSQLGYRPDELMGRSPFGLVHPDDVHAGATFASVLERASRSETIQYRIRRRDGAWRWLESVTENHLDDPAIAAVVVTSRDVTVARRRALQQQAVADLGGAALGGAPVEALVARIPAVVAEMVDASHCAVLYLGKSAAPSVVASTGGTPPEGLLAAGAMCPVTAEALAEGRPAIWEPSGPDPGRGRPLEALGVAYAAAIPVMGPSGAVGAIAVHSAHRAALSADDVSFVETVANILAAALNRRDFEAQLRHQALHDELTGLPNRTLLMDRLATALAQLPGRAEPGRELAVVFVDLDDFKLLNDTLGHSQGDLALATVAWRLVASVDGTCTVARFGGDEFVVIAHGADGRSARQLAAKIDEAIRLPIELAGTVAALTASVGVVLTSDPATTPDAILADADLAMYEAKRAGKKQAAVYVPEMRQRLVAQMETVSGIRRGLAESEFRLFYQPIFEASTGRIAGHEALIRWQHPRTGLVGPDQFIAHAESSGLIIPLGEWVLRTACGQAAAWRRAGAPSRVSINVSVVQLGHGDLTALVADALRHSGAVPSDITLEVTESAVMADLDRACETLDSLRRLGLLISMDDFGTGWSSLSQLTRLPFDSVKIDRSFVRDLVDDERAAHLLESIVSLCRALGLPVIAEGVETPEQLEHLVRLGVGFAQGFLLGHPAPA